MTVHRDIGHSATLCFIWSSCALYLTQQYSRNTTTCFGPTCGPSSGCDLTYREAIQDVWGVLFGYWELGGGERDLVVSVVGTMTWGCYKWIIISCLCTYVQVGCYSNAKDILCFLLGSSWFQTFVVFWIYYVLFWVVPRRLNYICRRFGTLYLFHLHRQVVWSVTGGENTNITKDILVKYP